MFLSTYMKYLYTYIIHISGLHVFMTTLEDNVIYAQVTMATVILVKLHYTVNPVFTEIKMSTYTQGRALATNVQQNTNIWCFNSLLIMK